MKIPTDPKDVKTIREFLANVSTQMCSMAECLTEPWKTHYKDLKEQYDSALKDLPPTDQVPAAIEGGQHMQAICSAFYSASSLVGMLGQAMHSMTQKNEQTVATALNSAVEAKLLERIKAGELVLKTDIDGLVTTALTARTTAGELVPKETVTQLCSAAKEVGLKEGEAKVRGELVIEGQRKTKISERKTALQKAGLPLPDEKIEAVLAGTDEEFKAAQTTAENRIAALQKKGVALNSKSPLAMKVWLPEEQYQVFESLAVETITGGDPLIVRPDSTPAPGAPAVMVC